MTAPCRFDEVVRSERLDLDGHRGGEEQRLVRLGQVQHHLSVAVQVESESKL